MMPEPHGAKALPLIAYRTRPSVPRIVIASPQRSWMNDTAFGFANRCLPLRIANQRGWFILNERRVEMTWNGGRDPSDLTLFYGGNTSLRAPCQPEQDARSHFGYGIVTWVIPYLFRTPPGYDLYVRGPSNSWKHGVVPLDAIVETDWAITTFTMNWEIICPGELICFEEGDPICMIFPELRGTGEQFDPVIRDLSDDAQLEAQYQAWSQSRKTFLKQLDQPAAKPLWQKHYYIGESPNGGVFSDHQLKLNLQDFKKNCPDGLSGGIEES